MNRRGPRGGGIFGGFFDDGDDLSVAPSLTTRSNKPPKVWGTLGVEGDNIVARLSGWRAVVALMSSVEVPLDTVLTIRHEPSARHLVPAKLRKRAGRSGLFRVGPYHSLAGWSFWSIGLGRNAVLIESRGRWRYVVIEVADPKATVRELTEAAGAVLKSEGDTTPPGAVGS